MTAPAAVSSTGPAITIPYQLAQGAPPVRITDGAGNTPAGYTLVNQGTHGQTVWIAAGANGAAVPLGPGGTLQWTDPAVFPYASVPAGSGQTETLTVTSQAAGYANPATVSAALIAQGIPSTFLSTGYGTFRLDAGVSTAPITVGQSASLLVSVSWSQPTPVGANVARLDFTDPAVPNLPAVSLYLTADNAVSREAFTWQVPVLGPALTVVNVPPPDANNSPCFVQLTGSNRAVAQSRMVGGEVGVWRGQTGAAVTGFATYPLTPISDAGAAPSLSPLSRLDGPVTLMTEGPSTGAAGVLIPRWVDQTGQRNHASIPVGVTAALTPWNHPRVPVQWTFVPTSSAASSYLALTITSGR